MYYNCDINTIFISEIAINFNELFVNTVLCIIMGDGSKK